MRAVGLSGALARIAQGGLAGAVIATETRVRLPLVAACGQAGMPVYVEKPLAHDAATLAQVLAAAAPVADRCMAGFMMRYHPAFRFLAQADLSDTYRFGFEIGHDVTRWRANWRFADSYAARPDGGGVLLDLCHEIDMAACLFPDAVVGPVEAIGHARFPGVDFATRILFGGPMMGSVAMDYLSPVSLRRIDILGTRQRHTFDLAGGSYTVGSAAGTRTLDLATERNDMFLAAMRDFLALTEGRATAAIEHLPRLDLIGRSSALIAAAHAARRFTAHLTGDWP